MTSARLIGVAVTLLGALTLTVLIPYGIVSPSDVASLALAPEFWPYIIASLFTLMGVMLTVWPDQTQPHEFTLVEFIRHRVPRLAAVLGGLFAYYLVVPFAGMVVPAMVLIFGLSWFAGETRFKMLATISVLIPVLLTAFFQFVANIPIPLGVFEFIYN